MLLTLLMCCHGRVTGSHGRGWVQERSCTAAPTQQPPTVGENKRFNWQKWAAAQWNNNWMDCNVSCISLIPQKENAQRGILWLVTLLNKKRLKKIQMLLCCFELYCEFICFDDWWFSFRHFFGESNVHMFNEVLSQYFSLLALSNCCISCFDLLLFVLWASANEVSSHEPPPVWSADIDPQQR